MADKLKHVRIGHKYDNKYQNMVLSIKEKRFVLSSIIIFCRNSAVSCRSVHFVSQHFNSYTITKFKHKKRSILAFSDEANSLVPLHTKITMFIG